MASEHVDDTKTDDPSTDPRADYDYRGGSVERPDLEADLAERVAGDVRFDSYSRELYATDASIYEVTPVGVVFPRSTADVSAVVSYCADRGIPVLPRGAGTSLAGQAVNEAVVLDFSRHMGGILEVDPEARTARAQPGVVLADLNDALADLDSAATDLNDALPHGLKFAPDPAWGDKSTLGGAIGNNSTGAHSLQYGKTDAYVEECEVVLADGTVTTLGEVPLSDLRERADPEGDALDRVAAEVVRVVDEEADAVESAFPDLKRNVSGYNLDVLVEEARSADDAGADDGPTGESAPSTVNLARLLAGSEGTLGVVTEATVSLEPVPATKSMALLAYGDLLEAVDDVAAVVEHDPAAVELVDDVLVDLASETAEFADVTAMLPDGTRAVLLVEFYADDDAAGREKVRRLLEDRCPDALDGTAMESEADAAEEPPVAFDALQAHDDADRERFWTLRKSGLPILLSRTTDEKHASFVEDCAVPPEHLRDYVADVREVLDAHGTYASFYAHAGPGVLHVRPLVNTKTDEGLADVAAIADEITDLVVEYGGSVSGEHGDGRARTQWNRKLYGDRVWALHRDLKAAFDPAWLLNPGPVAGLPPESVHDGSDDDVPESNERAAVDVPLLTENLRLPPDYAFDAGFDPALNWDVDNGMQGMAELCHGCGGCRGSQSNTGGVMCPTYRAAEEEVLSTRGRANLLRQAASGDLPAGTLTSDAFAEEVLDLCIGCKGCARDCPSEVDMAKLKAEVEHARHQQEGADRRERLFAAMGRLAPLASATAPLSNWLHRIPGARALLERTLGVASEPELPAFQRRTLAKWFARRGPAAPADGADRRALLVPDTFTNHVHPETGRAAVRVLEAAGVHVAVPDGVSDTGRPALSKGFLDDAREAARETVDALAPRVADGWDVVVAEPSDAVMLQSDYLDLLSGEPVERVAATTYGVCEYLDVHGLDDALSFDARDGRGDAASDAADHLVYHGHCHQKAATRDHHAVALLRRAGYRVDALDSGCCGMAGSFGYEAEHRSMSEAIAGVLFDQVADSDGERVVAPGASCRSQFASGASEDSAFGVGDGASADVGGKVDGKPPHPVEMLDAALAGDAAGE